MATTKNHPFPSYQIIIAFAILIIAGLAVLPLLPVQLNPNYSLPSVQVRFSWRNASPKAVEQEVTSVLEGSLNTIKGIENINSVSSNGSGRITLYFKDDTDMEVARFEVSSVVRNIYPSLPARVSYPSINLRGQDIRQSPVLTYALLSTLPPAAIKQLAEEEIVSTLSEIKGIHEIRIYGATPYRWHTRYDPGKMKKLGIELGDIQQAIGYTQTRLPLGRGNIHGEVKGMVLESPQSDTINWPVLPVKMTNNRVIRLGDFAQTSFEPSPPSSYYRINGRNTINMAIYFDQGENQMKLAGKVKQNLHDIENRLSGKLALVLKKDASRFIRDEVRKIISRSLLTLGILLLFVFLISLNLRYLMLIFISLAANITIAFFLYYLLGIELHLYSFAGITVSLGLLIDNSIVMIDHINHKQNRKVFLAIFASTLTTIGALSIIFFLDEKARLNLADFAMVLIINLSVSLFIGLFFIPALMTYIKPGRSKKSRKRGLKKKRRLVRINGLNQRIAGFLIKRKRIALTLVILGFGLPVFLLPPEIQTKDPNFWEKLYNNTFGSQLYNEKIRKVIDPALGGTLRLFSRKVDQSRFFTRRERTSIHVGAQMPQGATLQQMNQVFLKLEHYLKQFSEIDQFETFIYSHENARMNITFREEHEFSAFPFYLKDLLVSKAISLGSADWQVYGKGDGFNNSMRERTGRYKFDLYGYNYDDLVRYAKSLREDLLVNPRVQEVYIQGKKTWHRENLSRFVIREDKQKLFLQNNSMHGLYREVKNMSGNEENAGRISSQDNSHAMVLTSAFSPSFNIWNLNNTMYYNGQGQQKLETIGKIDKEKVPAEIHKFNQQYYLMVEYDFIGPYQLGHMHQDEVMEDFSGKLPVGYSVSQQRYSRREGNENKKYWLIGFIILIVYFTCAVLLESLLQPLAVIFMVPVTFTGVFLTFYLFDFNFDEGGYASFVLLCGLTVNAALYIINDLNNIRNNPVIRTGQPKYQLKTYLKAFNSKIVPAFLAILSTVLGMIPFLAAGQNESFWFPLAAGTSGGLLFSLVGIYFVLPLFFVKRRVN